MMPKTNPNDFASAIARHAIHSLCAEAVTDKLTEELTAKITENLTGSKHQKFFDALYKAQEPYEDNFTDMLDAYWEDERKVVVSNLKKLNRYYTPQTKDPGDLIDEILYPVGEFEDRLSEESRIIILETVAYMGQRELERLGIDVAFDVTNPHVTEWLKNYTPYFSKRLEEVSIELLRAELIEGLELGESIPELTSRVNKTYEGWTKTRSRAIARTEVNRATNKANLESYRQSGVLKQKVWIAESDACMWCTSLNGQVVSLEENYYNLGDTIEMEVEGETYTMSVDYTDMDCPPAHVNCRCAIGPWMEA